MNYQKKLLIIVGIAFTLGMSLGNKFFNTSLFSYQANIIEADDNDCSSSEHIITCKNAISITGGECEAMTGNNKVRLKADKFNGFCSFSTDSKTYNEIYLYRSFPIKNSSKKLYMKFVNDSGFIKINNNITGGMTTGDTTGATILNINSIKYEYNVNKQQWEEKGASAITYNIDVKNCTTLNGQDMINSPMCIINNGLTTISLAKIGGSNLYLSKSEDEKYYLHKNDPSDINKWSAEYLKSSTLTEGDFSITYTLSNFYLTNSLSIPKTYAAGTEAPAILKLEFGVLNEKTGHITSLNEIYTGTHDITDYNGSASGRYTAKVTLSSSEWNTLKNKGANMWRALNNSSVNSNKKTRWISLEDKDVEILGKDFYLSDDDNKLSKVIKDVNEYYSITKDGKTTFALGEALTNQVKLMEGDIKAVFTYDSNIFFIGNNSLFYTLAEAKEVATELINANCTDVSLQVINKESGKEANKFYQGFMGTIIYQHKTLDVPAVTWTIVAKEASDTTNDDEEDEDEDDSEDDEDSEGTTETTGDSGDIIWQDSNDTSASRNFKITDIAEGKATIKASAVFNTTTCETSKVMTIAEDMVIDVPDSGIDVYSNSL